VIFDIQPKKQDCHSDPARSILIKIPDVIEETGGRGICFFNYPIATLLNLSRRAVDYQIAPIRVHSRLLVAEKILLLVLAFAFPVACCLLPLAFIVFLSPVTCCL